MAYNVFAFLGYYKLKTRPNRGARNDEMLFGFESLSVRQFLTANSRPPPMWVEIPFGFKGV